MLSLTQIKAQDGYGKMFELGFPSHHPEKLPRKSFAAWNLTYSLIEFCKSHQYEAYREDLVQCLQAIEADDLTKAKQVAETIPLGGYGRFNDAFICPLAPHEDAVVAQTCFEALLTCWCSALRNLPGSTER